MCTTFASLCKGCAAPGTHPVPAPAATGCGLRACPFSFGAAWSRSARRRNSRKTAARPENQRRPHTADLRSGSRIFGSGQLKKQFNPCFGDLIMNSYEAKQAARKARYEARAGLAHAQSDAVASQASRMADAIPMGQPILVGHYS